MVKNCFDCKASGICVNMKLITQIENLQQDQQGFLLGMKDHPKFGNLVGPKINAIGEMFAENCDFFKSQTGE